ncbi:hypothetical protein VTO42DRAFT_2006 [Malbranchea cinnamomea]
MSSKQAKKTPRFLVIGAGSRGNAYARAVTNATNGVIHAVAEPDPFKRQQFGREYVWRDGNGPSEGQEFSHWREWLEWEKQRRRREEAGESVPLGVDGVFVCTLDETHVEIMLALAPLNLHVMCEKPLATSLQDCVRILKALTEVQSQLGDKIFSIGHVLRYSPFNRLLRKMLLHDRVIGNIISLEHTEPVGWSHFAHSYVRGNWRRETATGDGSLLTKCCHDIDFILWLLSSPPPGAPYGQPYHLPQSISSMGSLTQFKRSRKPAAAGSATNCLSCPIERECIYSAVRLYRDAGLYCRNTGWPVKVVCPDIEDTLNAKGLEAAASALLRNLSEDYDVAVMPDEEIAKRPWFGRCVWESDNNVCDDQVVTIRWDDDPLPPSTTQAKSLPSRTSKLAILHMIAQTEKQCERRGRVYGTLGEISYDSRIITTHVFATGETTETRVPPPPPHEQESHGGGDYGLTRAFVRAVEAVEIEGWDVKRAQAEFVGCTLEEAVRSHAVVFAAEEARRGNTVIDLKAWWEKKLEQIN